MDTFSALLAICAGNSPVPGEFPTQRPVTRSFDVFFDLRSNKKIQLKHIWNHTAVLCNKYMYIVPNIFWIYSYKFSSVYDIWLPKYRASNFMIIVQSAQERVS